MDAVSLKLARNYTNEKLNSLPSNAPTKTVTFDGGIYSVGSDVVNGQVSDIVIKGRSLKQELDYNRDTWAEWTKDTDVVGDSTGLEFVANGTNWRSAKINTNLKPSTKYGVLYNVVSSSLTSPFSVMGYGAFQYTVIPKTVGNQKAIITSSSITTTGFGLGIALNTEPAGNKIKIRDIRMFELPAGSEIDSDFTNLTADELAQKYPYISGDSVKSTVSAMRLKSVGKNLINGDIILNKLKSQGVSIMEFGTHNSRKALIAKNSQTFGAFSSSGKIIFDRFASSKRYTIKSSATGNDGSVLYYIFVYEDGTTESKNINGTSTSTLGKQLKEIRLGSSSDGTPIIYLDDLQLEEGTLATPYEPYTESTAIINLTEPLRSLPNGTKDEVSDGKLHKRTDKVILDGSINWLHYSYIDNNNAVAIYFTNNNKYNWKKNFENLFDKIGYSDVATYESYAFEINSYIPNRPLGYVSGSNNYNMVIPFSILGTDYATYSALDSAGKTTFLKNFFNAHQITLIYQLATPIVTKLPAQAPLQVFENGTVYVEPIGDASESTLPSVEMTIPTGTSNKFGVATHDYGGAAADWTLTNSESKCFMLAVSNAGGAANIIAPNRPGTMYAISNASGYTITIKISGGNGVDVNTGKKVLVIHDGTDYVALTAEL